LAAFFAASRRKAARCKAGGFFVVKNSGSEHFCGNSWAEMEKVL
jgi:hypothetical protein